MLSSCRESGGGEESSLENVVTMRRDTLTSIESKNGAKKTRLYTPLLEYYQYAKEPYMEFRRGIDLVTYDSLKNVESTLVADYAINFNNQKLWELKGNVKGTSADGRMLETQQLFWNMKTKTIYSNIDTKITMNGDVIVGVGFESDEDFKEWEFRRPRGKLRVNTEPTEPAGDSTVVVAADTTALATVPAQ